MVRTTIIALTVLSAASAQAVAGGVLCRIGNLADDKQVEEVAEELRAEGPAGLHAAIRSYHAHKFSAEDQARFQRLLTLVAGQRGALVSRLYWYTDLDEARRAASESGKPILSLRMLGKLTDEYCCANSRFFRTALYANQDISDYLRENYILHWQSVRPVPRVTIDFGDGRKLERTITGNSAHYVLNAAGRPIEALPGLYGPQAFKGWLVRSKELAGRLSLTSTESHWLTLLLEHHASRRNGLDLALRQELRKHAPQLLHNDDPFAPAGEGDADIKPKAQRADKLAISKSAGEAPILAAMLPDDAVLEAQDNSLWKRIAAAHADKARLDEASISLIRSEHPTAEIAGVRAEAKRRQEDPVLRLVRSFEQSMALDTVKNEYLLHRKIHEWFVSRDAPTEFDAFNEKVYAELFLTPSSDPWLGLAPADVYTALDEGGLTSGETARSLRAANEATIEKAHSRERTARR